MYSDFLLIQKVKNGNEEAGEWLVKKYYASIYQYCFLHVRNRDYAEDLTQDTFVRFFEALGQYKNYGKTKSYLLYCRKYHQKLLQEEKRTADRGISGNT